MGRKQNRRQVVNVKTMRDLHQNAIELAVLAERAVEGLELLATAIAVDATDDPKALAGRLRDHARGLRPSIDAAKRGLERIGLGLASV